MRKKHFTLQLQTSPFFKEMSNSGNTLKTVYDDISYGLLLSSADRGAIDYCLRHMVGSEHTKIPGKSTIAGP